MVTVSLVRAILQRLLLGFVAAWSVLTIMFAMIANTRQWTIEQEVGGQLWTGTIDEAEAQERIDAYLAERGMDRPLWEQYVDWMASMLTLDWGDSFATGEPALSVVTSATIRTAMYVLPAVALAITFGLLLGVFAALRPESRFAFSGVSGVYLFFAVPNFYVGGLAISVVGGGTVPESSVLFHHVFPIVLTTSSLIGGYLSFSRSHALEYAATDFVTLIRAKGARPRRIAQHVVRNGAIPLFSMLFVEVLALLVLSVFVIETLFGIEGLGLVMFEAIQIRDLPVLLGGTLVIVAIGVVCNIVQDISYTLLDPRVDTQSR